MVRNRYLAALIGCLLTGCLICPKRTWGSSDQTPAATAELPRRIPSRSLPNLVKVHEKVLSGGLPEGEKAFEELRDLGVKTIISVDGAAPNVPIAKRYGLRYVHLPHGYDGIPKQRGDELAKAILELDGVIYVHCHHGRHRSPAAASVACISASMISENDGLSVLELAGTSPNYRGLYQAVREASATDKRLLTQLRVEFREHVAVPPLAEAMVAIERTHDHLQQVSAAGWQPPKDHPDLEPAHEALLLREHFTELLRSDYIQQKPDDFQRQLWESESLARELEATIRAWQRKKSEQEPPTKLDRISEKITTRCHACHQQYRDMPRGDK